MLFPVFKGCLCVRRSCFGSITVIPGIISYVYASGNADNQAYHDVLAKSNVTSTTRMPRFLGVLVVLVGIALLIMFIVNYRDAIGINFDIGLKSFKIFNI